MCDNKGLLVFRGEFLKEMRIFKKRIWDFYRTNGRKFAWRNVDNPYFIMVSEIMLQQTQTNRVEQKYPLFITQFPHFEALAQASLRDVLLIWQGLGYNRRAKSLHESAQKIVNEYDGLVPSLPEVLELFPGIGKATAASVCAFAFNKPTVFIETNIRTVFIHHFFASSSSKVADKEIYSLLKKRLIEKILVIGIMLSWIMV